MSGKLTIKLVKEAHLGSEDPVYNTIDVVVILHQKVSLCLAESIHSAI